MTRMPSASLWAAQRAWDWDAITARVREVFFRVQLAGIVDNQELARECMSAALYQKHWRRTDTRLAEHIRNGLEQVALVEARVVSVADCRDDPREHFWVFIEGSLIGYAEGEDSIQSMLGNRGDGAAFTELWKFVRGPHQWLLDEIEPNAGVTDLVQLHNFSEVLAVQARERRAGVRAHV